MASETQLAFLSKPDGLSSLPWELAQLRAAVQAFGPLGRVEQAH